MRATHAAVAALAFAVPALAQSPKLELRAVVYGLPSTRNVALDATTVGEATGTMTGGEVSLRGRTVGLVVRLVNGDLTATSGSTGGGGTLTTGEALVQAGPRIVALEAGYARRAVGGTLGTTVYSFFRVGGTSALDIGGTGLSARLSAGVYLAGQGVPNTTVSGHEIIAALEYAVRRLPLVLTVGYRAEVFQSSSNGTDQPENVCGLIVGGGIRFTR
jgi:hypothetical protein